MKFTRAPLDQPATGSAMLLVLAGTSEMPARPCRVGVANGQLALTVQVNHGDPQGWMQSGGDAYDAAVTAGAEALACDALADVAPVDRQDFLLGALLQSYRTDAFRTTAGPSPIPLCSTRDLGAAPGAAARIADAVLQARHWVETPANLLTPEALGREAHTLTASGLTVSILDEAALEAAGARLILAVVAAAANRPCMAVVEWRGHAGEGWDAALIGKGVTFDAGGLDLKGRDTINRMKFDMAGGSAVLGAMRLMAERKAAANIVAIVPMVENVIGSRGYRPGDVLTSMAGLTVEIASADAEGRLILADAMTYARHIYAPGRIVDVATLTGAMIATLLDDYAGLMSNDDALAADLTTAGDAVGEPLWRLPVSARQRHIVKSDIADVLNLGRPTWFGMGASSPVAGAQFLARFAGDTPWAHLDIAGPAWIGRRNLLGPTGATGFGVRLLDRWAAMVER